MTRWSWTTWKQKLQRRLILLGLLKPEWLGTGWWRVLKAKDVEWDSQIDEACRQYGLFYIGMSSCGIFYYFSGWNSLLLLREQIRFKNAFKISGNDLLGKIQDQHLLPKGRTIYIEPKGRAIIRQRFRCTWKDLIFSRKSGVC